MTYNDRIRRSEEFLHRLSVGERCFSYAHLRDVELHHRDLTGIDLRNADLKSANLSGANLERADLRGAMLSGANLDGANLRGANLRSANLDGAGLRSADLTGAKLRWAKLRGAKLSYATLSHSNLSEADLSGADLSESELGEADLSYANLWQCNLRRAKMQNVGVPAYSRLSGTMLLETDLGAFCRAPVRHESPSHVDFKSIVLSVHEPLLKPFLRRSGMPDVFIEYMIDCAKSLDPELVFSMLQSTFISYGGPDEAFARKLNDALQAQGVTTFFFKDHATPGDKLHRVMRTKVNEHDRTILICSESSLQREGLLNELEEALAREARDGGRTYLVPVRLDDYVINGWQPRDLDLALAVRDRVIADFRDHEDPLRFEAELARLVSALKKPGPTL